MKLIAIEPDFFNVEILKTKKEVVDYNPSNVGLICEFEFLKKFIEFAITLKKPFSWLPIIAGVGAGVMITSYFKWGCPICAVCPIP